MLRFVRSWSAISPSLPQFAPARRHQSRRRLTLERLEDRAMLSTIPLVVNMLPDDPSGPTTGQMTLRDAITVADNGAITNPTIQYVITFKQGLTGTIDLTQSLPPLAANITIKGPGETSLTVERDSTAPGFSVFTVNSGETVTLSGLTIAGGNAAIYTGSGGGINNAGTLTVNDSAFADNVAYYGGAINSAGTLTVNDSTFTGNGVVDAGGAISNGGTTTVNNSTFINNGANAGGAISSGSGTLKVTDSTFSGNDADNCCAGPGDGGAILNLTNSTTVILDSSFSGNSANYADQGDDPDSYAGVIDNVGIMTVTNSTFANNFTSGYAGAINQ